MNVADLHDSLALPIFWRVGGVRLVGMQVGHARLLESMQLWSPEDRPQLAVAVALLSRDQASARRLLGRRIIGPVLRWMRWRLSRHPFPVTSLAWTEFVRWSTDKPFWAPVPRTVAGKTITESAPINTPMLGHLRVVLCGECGYDPATFDDAPLLQAILDFYAIRERNGDVVLATETHEGVMRRRKVRASQEPKGAEA